MEKYNFSGVFHKNIDKFCLLFKILRGKKQCFFIQESSYIKVSNEKESVYLNNEELSALLLYFAFKSSIFKKVRFCKWV